MASLVFTFPHSLYFPRALLLILKKSGFSCVSTTVEGEDVEGEEVEGEEEEDNAAK